MEHTKLLSKRRDRRNCVLSCTHCEKFSRRVGRSIRASARQACVMDSARRCTVGAARCTCWTSRVPVWAGECVHRLAHREGATDAPVRSGRCGSRRAARAIASLDLDGLGQEGAQDAVPPKRAHRGAREVPAIRSQRISFGEPRWLQRTRGCYIARAHVKMTCPRVDRYRGAEHGVTT